MVLSKQREQRLFVSALYAGNAAVEKIYAEVRPISSAL